MKARRKNSMAIESQNPNSDLKEGLRLLDKAYPQWYVDEVNEDLDNFRTILEQNHVEVIRPEWPFRSSEFSSPHWKTSGYDI